MIACEEEDEILRESINYEPTRLDHAGRMRRLEQGGHKQDFRRCATACEPCGEMKQRQHGQDPKPRCGLCQTAQHCARNDKRV